MKYELINKYQIKSINNVSYNKKIDGVEYENITTTNPTDELLDSLNVGKYLDESAQIPTINPDFERIERVYIETEDKILLTYEVVNINANVNLESFKKERIELSKKLLNDFFEENPLKSDCHNGVVGYYSVTKDKTDTMLPNFLTYQMELQAGLPTELTWNEKGKSCTVWTVEEYQMLTIQIKQYVKPIIAKQQHLEESIINCTTTDDVENILISYDEFKIF